MSDVKALIAEARRQVKGVFKDDGYEYLVPARDIADVNAMLGRLADALEAAQQAPAVDREALADRIREALARAVLGGLEGSPYSDEEWEVAKKIAPTAFRIADAVIASGVLQDAAEVEARGLEKAAEDVRGAAGLGMENSGHTSTYSVRKWLMARAQQVREGN